MSLNRSSRRFGWWEILALAPSTLLLAPLLFGGVIGLLLAGFGIASNQGFAGPRVREMTIVASIAAQAALGAASLACLWVLAFTGLAAIQRHPLRRWLAVAILAAGETDATYFVFGRGLLREITSSPMERGVMECCFSRPHAPRLAIPNSVAEAVRQASGRR